MDLVANRVYINTEFYRNTTCDFDWSVYYTAKECHIAMWNEIINMVKTLNTDIHLYYSTVTTMKYYALWGMGFEPSSLNSCCFACTIASERAEKANHHDTCLFCPLMHGCYPVREVPKGVITGHYKKFSDAFGDADVEKMIKYAEQIRDDWESEGE